jgi:hypothetical protein
MTWKLYLDDVRDPPEPGYTVVRNSLMAVVTVVQRGKLPSFMSLDHDLGGDDNTMRFLKELHHIWEEQGANPEDIPQYIVHSANPIGTKNIISFMESWRKSAQADVVP